MRSSSELSSLGRTSIFRNIVNCWPVDRA